MNYHPGKANVAADVLSQKTQMTGLMVRVEYVEKRERVEFSPRGTKGCIWEFGIKVSIVRMH